MTNREKLLEALETLPALYSQESLGNAAVAKVKLFNPAGCGTWYLSEYSKEPDNLAFGLCIIQCAEIGYVSLDELLDFKMFGIGIELDEYYTPVTLAALQELQEVQG